MLCVKDVWPFSIILMVLLVFILSNQVSEAKTLNEAVHCRQRRMRSPWPPSFFVGNRRPEGLPGISRGQEIHQLLPQDPPGTHPYFISLFDTDRNIPFYSAYKVTPQQAPFIGKYSRKDVRGRNWRNPPGVPGLKNAYKEVIQQEPLSRGHMNPVAINTFDKNFMKATFTLTNIIPQYIASNSGPWQIFEAKIRRYAADTCGSRARRGTLYLLTGTSEYNLATNLEENGDLHSKVVHNGVKLAIPRAVWTAGCCVWKESNDTRVQRAESFAVMSNNAKDQKGLNQTEMNVLELEKHLTPSYSPWVDLFPGDQLCRLPENTVKLR